MKRLICFLTAIGIASSLALAQGTNEVKSVNVVGYLKLNVASNFNQVCYNWKDIGGGEVSVQDIFDGTLLKSAGAFSDADNLYIWDQSAAGGAGGYKTLWLYYSSPPQWYEGALVATNTIKKGQAFWLRHKNSPAEVTIVGEVPNDGSNVVTFVQGFTMFGSAYAAEFDLAAQDWAGCHAAGSFSDADNLYIWDASASGGVGAYKTLWLYYSSPPGWYEGAVPYTNKVPMGRGMWMRHKPASPGTWTETKPYTL